SFAIDNIFIFPHDIAVGIILVCHSPGVTLSNFLTLLANGYTALSVTITSCTTLLAPFATPALIYLLASEWLPVSFMAMFMSVIKVVLIPIILGILPQFLFRPIVEKSVDILPTVSVVAIVMIVAAVVSGSRDKILETGLIIFAIVILHNGLGYLFGFLVAKLFKLK